MRRTAIDRSPKLKVGARVQVIVGYRAGDRGTAEPAEGGFWAVRFTDGRSTLYPSESLRVLPKLTSSKPVNPVNRKRKDAQFEKAFGEGGRDGEWIRSQPCSVPRCKEGPIHAHHAKSQGAGGDRRHLVPLCALHHEDFHTNGSKWFEEFYDVRLIDVAARLSRARELEWADPE